ncbi:hypothetical protein BofuT4_P092370.1 [Botrytis cinerea T4]|uniref:Uncharacterized protein n=1 Tax=Botryotinia fuckeliana (strain T4) TaxID=999810 RepID=G2YET0_BOTF4|nr:hypothetical protein BofuT4_P092370.1 [Botrytis cinerea T4]
MIALFSFLYHHPKDEERKKETYDFEGLFDIPHGLQSFKEWSRLVLHLALRRGCGGMDELYEILALGSGGEEWST